MPLLACVLVFAFISLAFLPGHANAYVPEYPNASLENAHGTIAVPYYLPQGYGFLNTAYLKTSGSSKARPSKVRFSGRGVATKRVRSGGIIVYFKKPGTVRLSYVWKGKKHSLTLKAIRYKKPVKKLKVGSKNFAALYKRGSDRTVAFSGTLRVEAAKGWKLRSIEGSTNDGWSFKKTLKNNAVVPDTVTDIRLTFYNKTTKLTQSIYLRR